jgi:aminoglycoside phosphotransferase (APT) family kinase protein
MGGGASKEQFLFDTDGAVDQAFAQCVLRMDPREGIIETCRRREAQALLAVATVVPVPPVLCVDGEGSVMGPPSIWMQPNFPISLYHAPAPPTPRCGR